MTDPKSYCLALTRSHHMPSRHVNETFDMYNWIKQRWIEKSVLFIIIVSSIDYLFFLFIVLAEGVVAGAKAAVVATIASAIPTV